MWKRRGKRFSERGLTVERRGALGFRVRKIPTSGKTG
jgi:hypothetical protein